MAQYRLEFKTMERENLTFHEFFAGGGMARIGLGSNWSCTFANDHCAKKATAYRAYFGDRGLKVEDVSKLHVNDLPGDPDLVWASFPCQDLSLAGSGAGLEGNRSGTFTPFWNLMAQLAEANRAPRLIVLENVVGALTSHSGLDFRTIVGSMVRSGYCVGALVIDAVRFVPQSRARLFIIAVRASEAIPVGLSSARPQGIWHPKSVIKAYNGLSDDIQSRWAWWMLPEPSQGIASLSSLIEEQPTGVQWHSQDQTANIIALMSPLHLEKLEKAKRLGKRIVGTIYKRTRPVESGDRKQRAEVRFDQVSGCLRTPVGGSSRQIIMMVEGDRVRSRLLSPREAARLMGVPDDYPLPENYNEAYHLFGDGLVVPVIGWLEANLLRPLALSAGRVMAA